MKKEKCPNGSKDENVFDIQQGVAIGLFIKNKKAGERIAKIYHADLYGRREKKYQWLETNDKNTTKWQELNPHSETYFFIPRDEKGLGAYEKYPRIPDIFSSNVTGIVTARDHFVIDFTKEILKRRIVMFRDSNTPDEIIRQTFKLKDTRGWKLTIARKTIIDDQNWDSYFSQILYRPFDTRHIYYTPKMVDWPRPEIMRHMLQENLGLITCRQTSSLPWQHALITNGITDDCYVSNRTRERGYLFPLYLYPENTDAPIFSPTEAKKQREPNLKFSLVQKLTEAYGWKPVPEEIFYYIYGVLYADTYRTKYAEFLKSDFPRIPFTGKLEVFQKTAVLGRQLADLHLLVSAELDQPIAKFPAAGNNRVEKVRYEKNRVYINADQYFDNIKPDVWQCQIGGYQVCAKWLKDRKNRELSLEDIRHYCRVVTALSKTISLQKELDAFYPEIEAATIIF